MLTHGAYSSRRGRTVFPEQQSGAGAPQRGHDQEQPDLRERLYGRPRLRAGLTDSPVTLMNAKWRANSVSPMIRPATWRFTVGFVAARMT